MVIERVQLKGNRLLKEVDTLSFLTRKGEELSDSILDLDRKRILKFYAENGFLGTEVLVQKAIKGEKVRVSFLIKEGRRRKFKWSGKPADLPVPIREVVASEGDLELNINRLLEYYANTGRPFTRIFCQNFLGKEDTIFYDLLVSEGESVWVAGLSFLGNLTKEDVLKRTISLSPPFLFSEKRITTRIKRLVRDRENPIEFLGMEISARDSQYNLKIRLKEKVSQELGLLLTFLPPEKELAGYLSLTLPNLFYTQRRLVLQWEKEKKILSYLFSYTEPFFLFTRKTKVSFANKTYDTIQGKTNLEIALCFLTPQEFITTSFLFGYERILEKEAKAVRFAHIGQELVWESREGLFPKSGKYFSVYSYLGNRKSNIAQGIKMGLKIEGNILFNLRKVVPSFSFFVEGIFADTLWEREKTYLGGRKRVRGFKEEELPSSFVIFFRSDLKFPLGNGFLFPFFDFGARRREEGYQWVNSFGFGLEILFGKSFLEFIYGVPHYEGLLSGRIHLLTRWGF